MADSRISPPQIYADWISLFKLLKNKTDDEAVLCAMKAGSVHWQIGVAEGFAEKLFDAVNFRLNNAIDKFQRELNAVGGQERNIVQAIISLRKELKFLYEAVNLPAVPENDRQNFIQLVKKQADSIQDSLEKSAKNDRSGKLLSIIKNNRVNSF